MTAAGVIDKLPHHVVIGGSDLRDRAKRVLPQRWLGHRRQHAVHTEERRGALDCCFQWLVMRETIYELRVDS